MKLNKFYTQSLQESLQELELIDLKVHTDDDGNVKAVELKYGDKKQEGAGPKKAFPSW